MCGLEAWPSDAKCMGRRARADVWLADRHWEIRQPATTRTQRNVQHQSERRESRQAALLLSWRTDHARRRWHLCRDGLKAAAKREDAAPGRLAPASPRWSSRGPVPPSSAIHQRGGLSRLTAAPPRDGQPQAAACGGLTLLGRPPRCNFNRVADAIHQASQGALIPSPNPPWELPVQSNDGCIGIGLRQKDLDAR